MNNKTFSSIKSTALFGKSVAEYWGYYFGNRKFPDGQTFYVVYTSIDQAIPFKPETGRYYWLINFELIPTALKFGNDLDRGKYRDIRNGYVNFAKEGRLCFRQVPTIMPHFTSHNGRALRAAQTLLKPINCCPSLHTATPFYFYNLGAIYFPEREPELRRFIGDVVSTVIQTKLHAMIDISFGLFLVKRVTRRKLGLEFNDLEDFFTSEQKTRDNVPYEHIYRMYHEINDLAKTMGGEECVMADLMERYFQELGLPRVKREKSNCYYDLDKKTLVYSDELTVGGGMF